MKSYVLAILCSVSLPSWALGNLLCKNGKSERKVEIVYLESGKKVPCHVKYTRESASGVAEEKVLYTAQAREGYCEEKATEFAGQLAEKGWSCSQVESP